MAFPASLLARPVRGADRELRRILEASVADYSAVQQPGIVDQVVKVLRAQVIFPETSIEDVATHLSLHPRTLNRRLQAEGTTFRKLLNQARFDVARQLLATTRMEITDIGLALGYADPSGFTHAFHRWSGAAPSEWRGAETVTVDRASQPPPAPFSEQASVPSIQQACGLAWRGKAC